MEKKTKLTRIFDAYIEDTITDEQAARLADFAIARIRAGESRRPVRTVYGSRGYRNTALALACTFVVSLAVCFTVSAMWREDAQKAMTEGETLLITSQSSGQQTIRETDTPLAAAKEEDETEHVLSGAVSWGGSAVEGAELRLLIADTFEVVATEWTGADGRYVFKDFEDGRYQLEIRLPETFGGMNVVQPEIYVFGTVEDDS